MDPILKMQGYSSQTYYEYMKVGKKCNLKKIKIKNRI